jgi:plasmid maintenance system antidote protein VapI
MTYEERIEALAISRVKSITAYEYFVERRWSLRKCAENMMVSHTQVKNLLEDLSSIDDDMYQSYLDELKRRKRK